jgi:2-polyprenyl-3-methyl-5-hydroxy-6-metoxy-1,4-benzoquinol methylase
VTMTAVLESPMLTGMCCGSCGGDSWSPLVGDLTDYLTQETFEIHRCNQCGLLMTEPLPQGQSIARYYPPQYRGNRHGFTGGVRSSLRRRVVESNFPKGFRGRLLDIGCGDGSFAMHMKSHGWEVSATEIDPDTVDRMCRKGVDAKLSGDAESDGFDQKFDAITCWHVMEHLEHPRQVTEWVKTQLAEDGVFQATVPNARSLQAKIFGRHWVHLDVPRHRQHYSPATLRSMLQHAGFEINRQSNFALEYDWFGIIQSALNMVCSRPNVLFDKLTHAPVDATKPASMADTIISYLLAPAIATMSLAPMLCAAALGDGATLTLTCKARD